MTSVVAPMSEKSGAGALSITSIAAAAAAAAHLWRHLSIFIAR